MEIYSRYHAISTREKLIYYSYIQYILNLGPWVMRVIVNSPGGSIERYAIVTGATSRDSQGDIQNVRHKNMTL